MFDAVVASAVQTKSAPAQSAGSVEANSVNGAREEITSFYTYDELRVLSEDLPEDVNPSMKEVTRKLLKCRTTSSFLTS